MVKEPSSFGIQPSYAGDTGCPLEYVNRVCASRTRWANTSAIVMTTSRRVSCTGGSTPSNQREMTTLWPPPCRLARARLHRCRGRGGRRPAQRTPDVVIVPVLHVLAALRHLGLELLFGERH